VAPSCLPPTRSHPAVAAAAAVVNETTWELPRDPPVQGCPPANSSNTLVFPGDNFMYRLVTTPTVFNTARFACWSNNDGRGNSSHGGRMWIPRTLEDQKRIEGYFEVLNPGMTVYWTGIKQVTWGSASRYVHQDNTRWAV
jgi:hypothetical protein